MPQILNTITRSSNNASWILLANNYPEKFCTPEEIANTINIGRQCIFNTNGFQSLTVQEVDDLNCLIMYTYNTIENANTAYTKLFLDKENTDYDLIKSQQLIAEYRKKSNTIYTLKQTVE